MLTKRSCILVLGMHRSGTSALTRTLNLLGATLPSSLMPAQDDNEAGFWESSRVMEVNDALLEAAGSCWDDWLRFDETRLPAGAVGGWEARIAEVLAGEFGDTPLIVLKDPRISRFTPFYLRVLESMGIDTYCLHMTRNPREVAQSLARRNGMPAAKAGLLWLRHGLDAELATRGRNRAFLTYDSLMEDGTGTARRLAGWLGDAGMAPDEAAYARVAGHIRGDLRHHADPDAHIAGIGGSLSALLADSYAALSDLAADPAQPAVLARLDADRARLDAAAALSGAALRDLDAAGAEAKRQLQGRLAEQEIEAAQLSQDMAGLRIEAAQSRAEAAQQATQIARLEAETAGQLAMLGVLTDEIERMAEAHRQRGEALNKAVALLAPLERKLARKRSFYQLMSRTKPFTSGAFRTRMRKKRDRCAKGLGVEPVALSPAVPGLSQARMVMLRCRHAAQIVPPSETATVPVVSVIIPVYNQIEYTVGCLDSLSAHQTRFRFEIIVVDDCSSDSTEQHLREIPWLRYIRQPQNGGFIESCNTGLAAARGDYVLFLNNDTRVQPGWLDELVTSFTTFPNAGLVGSKLIYPDGTLQEAGGIVWRDGSAWNYGNRQDPQKPEFCYARKVDYCSGASIALPRALMEELGGFDTYYKPAYYEDTDLAMRVRAIGRDVIYQPLSKVIHYEGVTSGTDTGSGVKAYQVTNAKKFFDRWKDTLAARPENADTPSDAKDLGLGKRVLIVDHITPEPDRDAGSVACMEIMRTAQSLGYQVTFIPYTNFADLPKYTAAIQRMGIEAIYWPYQPNLAAHLDEYGSRYDAILVFRVGCLDGNVEMIREKAPQARLIYHAADLHHIRLARQAELENAPDLLREAEAAKEKEIALVRQTDCTLVHSLFERDYLLGQVPGASVEVSNWILDPIGTEAPFEARRGVMFLGGFQHTPNLDAVEYFLDTILPLVRRTLPDVDFHVIGSNKPKELAARASAHVHMHGYVEDLGPIMDRCRMSVVPLRFGAGTKGKLAMSLVYGLPAVTTSVGAEGMGFEDGKGVFIADDPEAFAARIVQLHEDPALWAQMSADAVGYVRDNLSREAGRKVIRAVLTGA